MYVPGLYHTCKNGTKKNNGLQPTTQSLLDSCQHSRIHDLNFLGIYVAVPANTMAVVFVDALMTIFEKHNVAKKRTMDRVIKKKWIHLYRMVFGEMFLKTLTKYGRYPDASHQPIVARAIAGKHGREQVLKNAGGKDDEGDCKSLFAIDGMTQVAFYYWPLLMADSERLNKALEEKFQNVAYRSTFFHYLADTKHFGSKRRKKPVERIEDQICLYVPGYLDLYEEFQKYVDGDKKLSDFISEETAKKGFSDAPVNTSKETSGENEVNADVNVSITASQPTPNKPARKRAQKPLNPADKLDLDTVAIFICQLQNIKEHAEMEPLPDKFLSLLVSMQTFVNDGVTGLDASPDLRKLLSEYTAMVPLLVKLVRTLHVEINEHEKTVDTLNARISSLVPQDSYTYQGPTGHATQHSSESMTSEQTGKKRKRGDDHDADNIEESQDDDDGDVSLNSKNEKNNQCDENLDKE